jgi:uncharacterized protein
VAEPWDQRKALSNLRKHGVSFEEASTIDEDPFLWAEDDLRQGIDEARVRAVGVSD